MKNEIKLSDELVKVLLTIPESGMGYQIVNLVLKSGTILRNVVILNSSIALLNDYISPNDIDRIDIKES